MCVYKQTAESRLEHVLSYRNDYKRAIVAALTVYLDDSGTHLQSPVAVVGAWIAPYPQWKRFTREWDKARREFGFDVFHMAEFINNNPKSEFADAKIWNDAKKRAVLKRLRSIIQGRISKGFTTTVIKQDFDSLVTGNLRGFIGQYHYTYAVKAAIGFIEDWREQQDIREPIEYIFDMMVKGPERREIDLIFEDAVRYPDTLYRFGITPGCHSFRDKREILPLQAADLLAWTHRRIHAHRLGEGKLYEPVSETWNYFVEHGLYAKYQLREAIAEWVAKSPKPVALEFNSF